MTRPEFITLFNVEVDKASSDALIDFALDICGRLLPKYVSFSKNHSWGDVEVLKHSIDFCKRSKGFDQNNFEIQNYLDKVEPNIPDMDDFGDFDGSYALNASCAVYELLEYLYDGDVSHIFNISTYMTDTIDFELSEADPNLTDEELQNHKDIIIEWTYQLGLLANTIEN